MAFVESPFSPNAPVDHELFVGRAIEIDTVVRAAKSVARGTPQQFYVEGDYGVGKTSFAKTLRLYLEGLDRPLFAIHVLVGGLKHADEVTAKILENFISPRNPPKHIEALSRVRDLLKDYWADNPIFGPAINRMKLNADAPEFSRNFLSTLASVYAKVSPDYAGICLVIDEINGIANEKSFAHMLKNLVDENSLRTTKVPLLLLLCGTAERRQQMITLHKPVERLFHIAQIKRLDDNEVTDFFNRAFESVHMTVEDDAMRLLVFYSGGLPKLMHVMGEHAFWAARPGSVVDLSAGAQSLLDSASAIGKRYIQAQVIEALRSKHYRRLLFTAAEIGEVFTRQQLISSESGDSAGRTVDNFLRRAKQLGIARFGDQSGSYVWEDSLTRFYLLMRSHEERKQKGQQAKEE